jgi:peptidoglycan/xylan/chitin deacetylase (PgdA/CDA1 family)
MKHVFALAAFTLGALTLAARAQPNQPGTKWTDDQLRQTVDRTLTPKSWPNGARAAVALTFDTDSESPLLRDGTTSPTTLSASGFGAQSGIKRILAMLDRRNVPATFFVTGVDAMLRPEMLASILKNGKHEVGVHGWIHEFPPRLADGERSAYSIKRSTI